MPAKKNPTAVEAVDEPETIPFEYDGEAYDLLPTTDWTYETLIAYEEGKLSALLASVLVGDGHDRFRKHNYKVGQVQAFVGELGEALGIAGN